MTSVLALRRVLSVPVDGPSEAIHGFGGLWSEALSVGRPFTSRPVIVAVVLSAKT
jgi:hypothetical protein